MPKAPIEALAQIQRQQTPQIPKTFLAVLAQLYPKDWDWYDVVVLPIVKERPLSQNNIRFAKRGHPKTRQPIPSNTPCLLSIEPRSHSGMPRRFTQRKDQNAMIRGWVALLCCLQRAQGHILCTGDGALKIHGCAQTNHAIKTLNVYNHWRTQSNLSEAACDPVSEFIYTQTENPIIVKRACISYIAAIALYEKNLEISTTALTPQNPTFPTTLKSSLPTTQNLQTLTEPKLNSRTTQTLMLPTTQKSQGDESSTQDTNRLDPQKSNRVHVAWAIGFAVTGVIIICVTVATIYIMRKGQAQPDIINDVEPQPIHLYEIPSEIMEAGPLYDNVTPHDYRELQYLEPARIAR